MLKKFEDYLKIVDYHYTYYIKIRSFLKFCGEKGIDYINLTFENYMEYIIYLKNKGWQNNTINNDIKAIRCFYKFLIREGSCNEELLKYIYKIKMLKETKKIHSYITEEELDEIVSMGMSFCYFIDPIKLRAILYFLFFTGLRKQEFINLKRENIDLDRLTVYVKGKIKNRMEREVPFTEKVKRNVDLYFNTYPEITNAFNITIGQLAYLINDLKDFVPNRKRLTLHILRHGFGRLLARKGLNIRVAQKLLGHKNIQSTLIYYDVTIDEAKDRYWEKIK